MADERPQAPSVQPWFAPPQEAPAALPPWYSRGGLGARVRPYAEQAAELARYYNPLPHAAGAVGEVAELATPTYGAQERQQAVEDFRQGNYGKAALGTALGTAALGLDLIPGGAALKGAAKAPAKATGEVISDLARKYEGPGITAYHGTPHDFDRFDISKIGTGEGAQAYGHGLYFAENEGVARSYRDTLSRDKGIEYKFGDEVVPPEAQSKAQRLAAGALTNADNWGKTPQEVMATLKPTNMFSADDIAEANKLLASASFKRPGHMYEVNIKADPEHFLDYDKPISAQSEHVKEGLRKAGYDVDTPSRLPKEPTGGTVVNSWDIKDKSAVSRDFGAAGIPGIRYLDQGSRATAGGELLDVVQGPNGWQAKIKVQGRGGAGFQTPTDQFTTSKPYKTEAEARAWANEKVNKGASNYVVFNDQLVEVMRKYGLAGLAMLGGGAAGAGMVRPGAQQREDGA